MLTLGDVKACREANDEIEKNELQIGNRDNFQIKQINKQ